MLRFLKDQPVYAAGGIFILVTLIFLVYEQFWWLAIPLVLALALALVLSLDKVLWFLIMATPLSVPYADKDLNLTIMIPTEPFLLGGLLLLVFTWLYQGKFLPGFVRHPVSVLLLLGLGWMAVTTLTSSMPLVSAKFLLSRMWLVAGYYFLMATLLTSLKDGRSYFLAYMIPLAVVVIYTLVGFAERGLNKNIAVWVMSPLFKEHTSYGAVLAMYFPAAVILAVAFKEKLLNRGLLLVLLGLLTIGLITSYTRAAWLSVFVAAGAAALVFLRINRWQFGIVAVLGLVGAWFLNDQFFGTLQRNTQDSSDDISEHVQSISNISTDASNLERINRWNSALRMWHERPVVGFGPGTYQFQYAPYQNPYEKTIISTNAGDVGNAHSEYLGPLAEQGLPGMLLVLVLFGLIVWTGVRVLYREAPGHRWYLSLAAWLGLITYMAHGFLNNFLEMDKAALPFWGFTAWLVLEDIRTSTLQKKL